MEDRDWLILQILHEQKNITRTAQALFISQPALTARLRQIEEEFGAKIVHRTTKGVHFSPKGEYLAKESATILAKLREIKDEVMNMDSEVAGTLRICASQYMTMYKLPKILKMFKDKYPQVEYKVSNEWSRDILNVVYNQEAHIGFARGDYNWHDEKLLLFDDPLCIASVEEFDLAALPKLPRIDFHTDYSFKIILDTWWREHFSAPPYISMEVDKMDACKEMVLHGLGYGILPYTLVKDNPTLHIMNLTGKDGQVITRRAWMLYQKATLETNIVRAFVDFVKGIDFNKPL